MTHCYSASASAPLNSLANQLLGESSFVAKPSSSSSFRPLPLQHQHPHYQQTLFPSQPRKQHQHSTLKHVADPFDQAWSTSLSQQQQQQQRQLYTKQYTSAQSSTFHHTFLPDLGLVTAWEQHHPPQNQSDQHHLRQVQTTLSGVSMVPPSDLNLTEFEAFAYTSNPLELTSVTQSDPAWAHEWSRQQGAEPESDEDDDKDEFREEWNNDHFTQAYINSHRSQFKEIEEQDRLKEARREEEQERQRQVSGGPPRSAWMIAGASTAPHFAAASTTVVETMNISHGSKRLRVPGLDDAFDQQQQQQERHRLERDRTMFSVDEFMGFDQLQENNLFTFHGLNASPPLLLQQHVQPKAIHAQDRFLSLVSDLHLAEQIYYPGASSATLPELSDPHRGHSSGVVAAENGWADQWVSEDRQQKEQTVVVQRYVGAEWNWEKLFGKDPRRQLQLATEANSHSNNNKESNSMDEGDRLRAVALTRLRAVFGHLSLTSSPIHGAPSSTPDVPGP